MSKLLKWEVSPAPTGRYRSFDRRGWPSAYYKGTNEQNAVSILCEDDYEPANVKAGNHAELKVVINVYRDGATAYARVVLKQRFKTLKEAKEAAEKFLENRKEFLPKSLRG